MEESMRLRPTARAASPLRHEVARLTEEALDQDDVTADVAEGELAVRARGFGGVDVLETGAGPAGERPFDGHLRPARERVLVGRDAADVPGDRRVDGLEREGDLEQLALAVV